MKVGKFPIRYGERIGFEEGEVYSKIPEDLWNKRELIFFKAVLQKHKGIVTFDEYPIVIGEDKIIKAWMLIADKYGIEYKSFGKGG